jgi:hypothetical protein
MFDTKISIVVREDLATWQKLNVVAFLTSGVVGATSGLVGEPYEDAAGNRYNPLMIQPAIVLSADRETLKTIYGRAMERRVRFSLYIEDMFATGHDAANRATVKQYAPASTRSPKARGCMREHTQAPNRPARHSWASRNLDFPTRCAGMTRRVEWPGLALSCNECQQSLCKHRRQTAARS